MRRLIFAASLLPALAAGGCTTMEDVERSEPYYSGTFAGDYQSLSACIALGWNRLAPGRYQQVLDPTTKSAIIIGTPDTFTALHVSHTTVRQLDDGNVAVEYRKPPRLFGTPGWVWETVEECEHQA